MYVISIKRVKSIFGEALETPEWEYACYDNFSGSMSTGYPIFAGFFHAINFSSLESAEEWIGKNYKYIGFSCYDISSLGIRKVSFKTVKMLK